MLQPKNTNLKLLATSLLLFLLLTSNCYSQKAGWIKVPVIKNGTDNNIRSEIIRRLPNTSIMNGEDIVGQGHYGGHGMNSYVREKYMRGTEIDNAAYCFGGWSFVAPEPTQFTLTDVIRRTGINLPGGNSNQIKHWNQHPLYIFDELSAYTCGTIAGIQSGQSNSTRTRASYRFAKNLLLHAKTVVVLADEREYPHTYQLNSYVKHIEKIHSTVINKYIR